MSPLIPLLFALVAPLAADDDAPPARNPGTHRVAAALHLSSFASRLCAKLDTDGTLDSGAGVVRFYHGDSGVPLEARRLRYGLGPQLWGTFFDVVDQAVVNVRAVAMPAGPADDRRVDLAMQVAFENPFDEPRTVRLRAELMPGGGDPGARPVPALAFRPDARFAREGDRVTRDGTAVLAWEADGQLPRVTVEERAGAPEDPVCVLDWTVELGPREARWAGLHLAGPSSARAPDEAAWRASFPRYSYDRLEEQSTWQALVRPEYALCRVGEPRLWFAMLASVHYLRALGDAHEVIHFLTDRPFGHPASDAAFEPGVLAVLVEWGMLLFAQERLAAGCLQARERAADLSPDKRLEYLDGLARAARMTHFFEHDAALAEAILELAEEGAQVPPWSDPEEARSTFMALVVRAGMGDRAEEVPHFRWAEAEPGSVAAAMVGARQGLAAGDPRAAWTHVERLLDVTSVDGMGSMEPGAVFDGRFAVGIMSIARALVVDDHGEDLVLLPGLVDELLPDHGHLFFGDLVTTYGPVTMKYYWGRKHRAVGAYVSHAPFPAPRELLLGSPSPFLARRALNVMNGTVEPRPDGLMRLRSTQALPLKFDATVRSEEP